MLEIRAVASMGAIDTIFFALNAWCTSIPKVWIVHLDLLIVVASEENGEDTMHQGW